MTTEEHKQKHAVLHSSFDELFADYITHHPEETNFTQIPIIKLMEWSFSQTQTPTELKQG